MKNRSSFEEACHAAHCIVTGDALRTAGVEATMAKSRATLAEMGWTYPELSAEAKRRFLIKLDERKWHEACCSLCHW